MASAKRQEGVVGGFVWKFAERLTSVFITFIVSLVLARLLSPNDFGIVSIVLVFISFADVFVVNGFSTALIQKKDADETDFSTIFYCSLIVALVIYAILFFTAPFIASFYNAPILTEVIRVFAIRLPISALNSVQHAFVSRAMIFKKYFFSTLIGGLVSAFVGIFMAVKGYGVWAIVGQYLSSTVVNSIVLLFTISWRPRLTFSKRSAKTLMGYGWKVTAAAFSGTFFGQLRSLLIGKFYTTADLAFYDRGNQFSSLATTSISSSLIAVLFPAFANDGNNVSLVKQKLSRAIRVISYSVLPLTIGIALVAKPMVEVLLTSEWLGSVPYIQILCASAAVGMLGDISLQAINAIGRSDVVLKLEFIKKPVFLILLVIGVWQGVLAVALSMLAYSVYSTVANTASLKKYIGYKFREIVKDILPAFWMTAVMAVFVLSWNFLSLSSLWLLIIEIVTGIVVYLVLSILTKNASFLEIWGYLEKLAVVRLIKRVFSRLNRIKCKASFYLFRIFGVKKNKIVFENYYGKGFGDNGKYIAKELLSSREKLDIVWTVKDKKEKFPSGVRSVKRLSLRWVYEMATAGVWVDNSRKDSIVRKRKNQYYIQTWHGDIGFKRVEKDAERNLSKSYIKDAKNDSKMADLFLSGNAWFTGLIKSSFWYDGEILERGYPRRDGIYKGKEYADKLKEEMGFDQNKRIVFYAPTFRRDVDKESVSLYHIEWQKLFKALKERFGGEWTGMIRLHPNLSKLSHLLPSVEGVYNATNYPDVQELLAISDICISDYSSTAFEFAVTGKPSFIYATDIESYKRNRGLYFEVDKVPFPVATNGDELVERILDFNEKAYGESHEQFYVKVLGLKEDGNASKAVAQVIIQKTK